MQETVCLLEPNEAIARLISVVLKQDNIRTVTCDSKLGLMEALRQNSNAIAIIDVGITPGPALELIRRIKAETSASVIAMSASLADGIARSSIEAGANDYQVKPFDPDVLLERVHFLLGRPEPSPGEDLVVANARLRIDLGRRVMFILGKPLIISRTEWSILRTLALNAGRPVFHADLARASFDAELVRDAHYLDIWTRRLQQRIGDDPNDPQTLRPFHNIAYSLAVGEAPPAAGTATGP